MLNTHKHTWGCLLLAVSQSSIQDCCTVQMPLGVSWHASSSIKALKAEYQVNYEKCFLVALHTSLSLHVWLYFLSTISLHTAAVYWCSGHGLGSGSTGFSSHWYLVLVCRNHLARIVPMLVKEVTAYKWAHLRMNSNVSCDAIPLHIWVKTHPTASVSCGKESMW